MGLLLVLALMAAVVSGGKSVHIGKMLSELAGGDLRQVRLQLSALGPEAVCVLILLVLAHTVVPFPAEILAASAGFALGFALALPVLLGSFVLSAWLAYLIGLRLGRPLGQALVGSNRLLRAERIVERGGVRTLLAVRLFPLMPFSPVCVACGIARVPVKRYLWTTAAGMLPELALVTWLGSRLQSLKVSDPGVWLPLLIILILVVVGPWTIRKAGIRGPGNAEAHQA